jgi:hypothetical protein
MGDAADPLAEEDSERSKQSQGLEKFFQFQKAMSAVQARRVNFRGLQALQAKD